MRISDGAAANPWALFESIPEMVVVVGTDGLILYANERSSEIVGWGPAELTGQPIEMLIPQRLDAMHRSLREGYAVGPRPRAMGSMLLTAMHSAGHEVPVDVALSPLSGPVTATVATVRDVTEKLQTAALLAEAQTRLEVLDDRDRIARELHDSVIQRLFAAGLHLQASANRPDVAERVSVVVNEIDEAIREIRGAIFTLHRPAQVDSGLEAALRASINDAARWLGHPPTLRLGGILTNISAEMGVELLAVLREGLMNVAKHAQATKTEVSLDVTADAVTLVVRDDGVGMPESGGARSTGLGLRSIAERAELMGGQATFVPGVPRGTELRWMVPRGSA